MDTIRKPVKPSAPEAGATCWETRAAGFDIGRQGMAAVLRHHDGRGIPTMLTKLALEHFGLTEPEQLVSFVYGQENVRSALGEASRLVFAAAKEGDRALQPSWRKRLPS
ncbi:hypothetical protein LJK88_17690 [Paenibacillus sp. P26]|nr:hypothetical protein LJK88_17690 [Paenibacillus sp. P26]